MKGKIAIFIFLLIIVFSYCKISFAQINCDGKKLFTEEKCNGDEIDAAERELYRIVNEYRLQNNLPAVPISDSLSVLANRHLLDIVFNLKNLTHSWSNCPFDIKDSNTWNCVFDSPKRLKIKYKGKGFENLYRTTDSNVSPFLALEAWKKSPSHRGLILNSDNWKETKFNAIGIAIYGQYAAVWFGSAEETDNDFKNQKQLGLGITFDKAVDGLTEIISIRKASSTIDSEQWQGSSADNSVLLEVIGIQAEVSQATISIRIKLEKNARISLRNRGILNIFIKNIAADWKERETWLNTSIKKVQLNPKSSEIINIANKTFIVSVDSQNYLSITAKPFEKPVAKEIK